MSDEQHQPPAPATKPKIGIVRLRRNNTGVNWGFRMQGGRDVESILYIQKVNQKSLAYRYGLRVGDGILKINDCPAQSLNHEQAKMEILRAGNELDLVVQRNAMSLGQDQTDGPSSGSNPRTEMVEESTEYRGYTNPNVQSRSFKIIQESLKYSEAGAQQ